MALLLLLLAISSGALAVERISGYKGWAWYEPGRDNVVLAAPHGGLAMPAELPRRHNGCMEGGACVYRQGCTPQSSKCRLTTVTDSNTIQLTEFIAASLRQLNLQPHVVVCNVSRKLIDLNRPIDQACMGVAECEKLYNSWHGFIEKAIRASGGVGLFIDVHGQAHAANWTELGYRINKRDLNAGNYSAERSSIHQLQVRSGLSLEELLTGRSSMGHYLSEQGYRTVPSGKIPRPGSGGYYRGGYNTETYGSTKKVAGRCTDAIQFEVPSGLRMSGRLRKIGADFAAAIQQFHEVHNYGGPDLKCAANADLPRLLLLMMMAALRVFA